MRKLRIILIMFLLCGLMTACTGNPSSQKADNTVTPENTDAPQSEEAAQVTVQPTTAAAQENTSSDTTVMRIAALKGPTAIGMVKLMMDSDLSSAAKQYTFSISGTADEISTGLVKGDYDVAALPCNLAAVLYNNTKGKIKLAGINTLGVLYIVETGDTVKSVSDLKGKTIYATGLGTTPQYTLNYVLRANGIDPDKDVTIEYKTEPTEVAAMLAQTDNAIAMLPQPYVTTVLMQNDKLRIALNISDEWDRVSTDGSSVVTGVVVVRSEFLKNHKDAFDEFMKKYTDSVTYVNNNIDAAAQLVENYDIFKAAPIKKAIPNCNITMIQGEDMKKKVSGYLSVLYNQEPKSVGGKLPDEDFYYIP